MAETAPSFTLEEVTGWSLTQASGWPQVPGALERLLEKRFGAAPERDVGAAVAAGPFTLIRVMPERIWIVGEGETAPALDIPADIGCLTPLGGGRRRFRMAGTAVPQVLAKLIALDLEGPALAPGRAALTALHRVPVLLHRRAATSLEIYLPRTFAESLLEVIGDAALEFADAPTASG